MDLPDVSTRVERSFDVDAATMWSLWTDPEHLTRWFRPSLDEFGPSVASMDLRPGGDYRIEMVRTSGEVHAVSGRIVDVEEPTRLSMTWQWDGVDNESYVEVSFRETQGRTTVTIDHSRLLDQADAERHSEGWNGCLASLTENL